MLFPAAALGLRTELNLGGTWTDISRYAMRDPVVIGRGKPDESTTAAPTTLTFTLKDEDGRFASRNPAGPYYGLLRRNTPCRVSVPVSIEGGSNYLRLEADTTSSATTPDSVALQITGPIDIRVDCQPTDFSGNVLAAKWGSTAKSWIFGLDMTSRNTYQENIGTGSLIFLWFDGTNVQLLRGNVVLPYFGQRIALRCVFTPATGTAQFYTAATMAGTWTQLGATQTFGATTLANGAGQPVQVGGQLAPFSDTFVLSSALGMIYEARVYSGATLEAGPVFSGQAAGTASFADAQGSTWTLNGTAEISDRDYRVHAELAAWPQDQDPSGHTVYTAVDGGGILRRISQRSKAADSPMYRAKTRLPASDALAAYWPCEDGSGATSLGSALGGPAMQIGGPSPSLSSSSAFACSSALPVMNGAYFFGQVPQGYAVTDAVVRFLWSVPSGGEANGATVVQVFYTGGAVGYSSLVYGTGGSLSWAAYSPSGSLIHSTGAVGFAVDGQKLLVTLELKKNGSSIDMTVATLAPGASSAEIVTASAVVSGAVPSVTAIQAGSAGITGSAMGHFSVQGTADDFTDLSGPLSAWDGEPSATRFARICSEEGIACRITGSAAASAAMGTQTVQTVTQLLQECADADLGAIFEPKQVLGLGYRTRASTGNQPATVTLSYNSDHLDLYTSPPLEDDQIIVNDVTVTAPDGTSVRMYAAPGQPISGGNLNVSEPPAGAGRYDQSYTVNIPDGLLLSNAGIRLHAGTIDEPRFPGIGIDLANTALAALLGGIAALDIGGRLVITGPQAWLAPGPAGAVDQAVDGYQETLREPRTWQLSVQGVPYSAYPVLVVGDGTYGFLDTAGSVIHANAAYGAATIQADTTAGPLWTTAAGDMPLLLTCQGMTIEVSAVSGTSSPQTLTVAQWGVNGVQVNLTAGSDIRLAYPPVLGM